MLSRADSFSGLDPTVTPASKADKRGPGIDEVIEDVGMAKPDLQEGSPGNDEDQAECNKSKASGQLGLVPRSKPGPIDVTHEAHLSSQDVYHRGARETLVDRGVLSATVWTFVDAAGAAILILYPFTDVAVHGALGRVVWLLRDLGED